VLDHDQRDGVPNLISIVGGKLTTCRMMAERTVDTMVAKRGLDAPCTTATTPLPGTEQGTHQLAHPLASVETEQAYGELICECELVTRREIEAAVAGGVTELDDLRRQHRFGFGPCQGAFCAWRGAAIVAELAGPEADGDPLDNLRRFLQERWRGLRTVTWGGGAVQALLNDAIYRGVLGLDALPAAPGEAEEVAAARPAEPGRPPATAEAPVGGAGDLTGDSDGRAATAGRGEGASTSAPRRRSRRPPKPERG
jgi:glycerol-3-phosphate dehydrogenase